MAEMRKGLLINAFQEFKISFSKRFALYFFHIFCDVSGEKTSIAHFQATRLFNKTCYNPKCSRCIKK